MAHPAHTGHAQPLGKHRIGTYARARQLRAEAAQIAANIENLTHEVVVAAERHGWNNTTVLDGDYTLKRLELQRAALVAEAKRLEAYA